MTPHSYTCRLRDEGSVDVDDDDNSVEDDNDDDDDDCNGNNSDKLTSCPAAAASSTFNAQNHLLTRFYISDFPKKEKSSFLL